MAPVAAPAPAPALAADGTQPVNAAGAGSVAEWPWKKFELTADSLREAIRTAKRGSAGAGSGWLIEHIKAVALAGSDSFELLHNALNVVATGALEPAVAHALSASTLVALVKPEGGMRPVAIGEVLPRVVARAACVQLRTTLDAYFKPNQFGVMAPGGAEQVCHAITAHLAQRPGDVVVSLDAKNAFNSVNRAAILKALLAAPVGIRALFPLVAQFYLHDAALNMYDDDRKVAARLQSKSGTRQGDPLGPLLFALAIHPIITRVQVGMRGRGVYILAYLDDIYVLGPPDAAAEATRQLRTQLKAINLDFNDDKCVAWSPSGQYGALVVPDADGFALKARPEGIKILGAHFGPGAAARTLAALKDESKAKSLARKLKQLVEYAKAGHHAYALLLLLRCAAPTPNYVIRVTRPADAAATAAEATEMLVEAYAKITQISADELAPGTRARAHLGVPQSSGGPGLALPAVRIKSAYFASWAAVGPAVAQRFPHLAADIRALAGPTQQHEHAKDIAAQREYCAAELQLDVSGVNFVAPALKLQHLCGEKEGKRALAEVHVAVETHEAAAGRASAKPLRAWAKSLECDGRAAFLQAAPARWAKPLKADDLEFAMRRLLRLKLRGLTDHNGPLKCSCGELLDEYGDHADTCKNQSGQRFLRHSHVNEKGVVAPARQSKLSTSIEALKLVQDTDGRPADTLIEYGHGLGDDVALCLDVMGCGTCARGYVDSAARWAGGAWQRGVDKKLRNACKITHNGKQLVVVPMAFDSQGGLHPNWRIMYNIWARRWASFGEDRNDAERGAMVANWVAYTSVAIQRAQSLLVRRTVELARSAHLVGDLPNEWRMPDLDDLDARPARVR